MTNSEIAAVFDIIADLLEIQNENFFKVRAFRNSSHIVESLLEDLRVIYSSGKLKGIKGLGEHSIAVIADLLENGQSSYLNELKETIPPSILELIQVPGIGPKKAKLFYDELGIMDLNQLEQAVRMHKLQTLKGIGAMVEEGILKNLTSFKKGRERFLLSEAGPHAAMIVNDLSSVKGYRRAEVAGSLRRRKETIGDIDILVTSEYPELMIEKFTTLPYVVDVIQKGPTKAEVKTVLGIQVDIRVVPDEDMGAALLYFTGSKDHNVKLRDLAKRQGLKINEYGAYKLDTGKKVAGLTEVSMYKILGMPYIEPEMRENKGEIEAALAGSLPKLVELSDIRGDLHIHSNWTDGVNTLEQMIVRAIEKGYEYVNMSDHADKLKVAHGLDKDHLLARLKELSLLQKKYPQIRILHGIEANIDADGAIDYDEELLSTFDVIVASVHWGFSQSSEQMTRRIVNACKNPYVHLIGHLTGRLLGKRQPYELDVHEIFKACAQTGTVLELNAFPDRLDLKDDHLRIAKQEYGLKFAINTDSHSINHFNNMGYGVSTARRAWLTKDDIINAYPVDMMLSSLKKHKEPGKQS